MSKFRNVPFFSAMLPIMLIGWTLRKMGKAKRFLKIMAWLGRNPSVQRSIFGKFVPDERDTFAAVFTKSGTNMLMQTMLQIAWLGEAEFEHIHDLVPWPEFAVKSCVAPLEHKGRAMESPTGLRVIKAHTSSQYIPYREKSTYVTVIRDPKEVCVSGFFFILPVMGVAEHITLDEWVELFLSEDCPIGSWARHTDSFWRWRDRPNVLVLTFNEMKTDIKTCTKRIADIMGVKLSPEQFARVLEQNKFSYMQAQDSKFAPPLFPLVDHSKSPKMVRSGKSGNSGELLSRAQQAAIDKYFMAELERLGSDFPYRELFEVVE